MKQILIAVFILCMAVIVGAQTSSQRVIFVSANPPTACVSGKIYTNPALSPAKAWVGTSAGTCTEIDASTAAPANATYITETANSSLTNEFALGSLATGILKNTTTTGVPSVIVPGTGVEAALAVNVGSAGAPVLFNGAGGTPSSLVGTNITGTASGLTAGTASAVAVGGITGLGTGVATALAVNVGTVGAFVVNGGALGIPASGTVTNLTGTASININGTVGATTPLAGFFTNGTFNGTVNNAVTGTGTAGFLLVQNSTDASFIQCAQRGSAATGTTFGISRAGMSECLFSPFAGGTAVIGTNNSTALVLGTNNIVALTIGTDQSTALAGNLKIPNAGIIYPASDSTTAIKIGKTDGSTIIGVWDTTNSRLRIGSGVAPTATLDVTGAALVSTTLGVTGILTASAQQTIGVGATSSALTDLLINPTTKASGRFLDAQINGATKFYVDFSGAVTIPSGSIYQWSSGTGFLSASDSVIRLTNGAQTDFGRLQFGGTTSSFPAIGRSTTRLTVGLADGTAGGGINFSTAAVISVASGTNQRAGNAVLVGGTVTVSNTTITSNSIVLLTRKTSGGTIGTAVTYTLNAGTSFTINSDNILDTSTFSYMLIEVP